jgi:hypothetical protein
MVPTTPDRIITATSRTAVRRVTIACVKQNRKITQVDWIFARLIRGSSETKEEATVHKKNNQIGRSNGVRRNPVFPVRIVRRSHPVTAMARDISAAAIEWGANAEYRTKPAMAVCCPTYDHCSPLAEPVG